MHARVHMCVCCTHLSIFGDGQQLVALVLSSLLYWKQSAVSPKGPSWSFHSQARGSAPPRPCPQGGGGRFGGCCSWSRGCVAHPVWGCWLGSPDTVLSFSSLPFPGRAALSSCLLPSPSCGCRPHPGGARLNPGWGSEGKGVSP